MINVHREGYATLLIVFVLLVLTNYAVWSFWPNHQILQLIILSLSALIYLFFQNFFRNPTVKTPTNPEHIIAPANGKVVILAPTEEPEFLKGSCLQISIFMSPLDVHVNRMPVNAKVVYYKYHPGRYLVAWHPKSSVLNERTSIGLLAENGKMLLVRQIAGTVARRIKCYLAEGDTAAQGQEFGFIKFGSRVDVFLPLSVKPCVSPGDKVVGGVSVLAKW